MVEFMGNGRNMKDRDGRISVNETVFFVVKKCEREFRNMAKNITIYVVFI